MVVLAEKMGSTGDGECVRDPTLEAECDLRTAWVEGAVVNDMEVIGRGNRSKALHVC